MNQTPKNPLPAFLLLSALAFGLIPAEVTAAAPIAATVTYESRWITADGVEKTTRFSEHLIRTDKDLWTERIIPRDAAQDKDHEHGEEHMHPSDLAGAAKHLNQARGGAVSLSFVRKDRKVVVVLEPRDYEQVGFDGSWDAAWSLIDPAALKQMKTIQRPDTPAGATWYEQRGKGRFTRVLWSNSLRIALEVESGSDDGSRWARTRLSTRPVPAQLPWNTLAGYQRKDYTELLD